MARTKIKMLITILVTTTMKATIVMIVMKCHDVMIKNKRKLPWIQLPPLAVPAAPKSAAVEE